MFFFLCVFFCVVRCGTRSLSRRALCPLLKVVLEAKNRPPKKNEKIVVHVFFILFCVFYFIFLKIKILPIFSILGYLNAFCCLFVAKLPLTFAKLNSTPLNRAFDCPGYWYCTEKTSKTFKPQASNFWGKKVPSWFHMAVENSKSFIWSNLCGQRSPFKVLLVP